MASGPLTVAIVGCGRFSDEHVKEIRKTDMASVVAACDREPLLAEQLAERYHIPHHYSSLEEMFRDIKPDIVHIITPPKTHLQIGSYACELGSHIYVEKPFTVNYPEALQLIDIANRHNRKVTVGHIYHFDPAARQMRALVSTGLLGEPVHVEAIMSYDLETEFGRAFQYDSKHWIYDLPGGLFQNVISHLVEKVLEFLPDESPSVEVHAFLRNPALRKEESRILDELRVMLAGKEVTAQLTFSSNFKPAHSFLRIYGTKNTMEVDFNSQAVILRKGKQLPTGVGRIMTSLNIARQYQKAGFRNINRFLRSDFHFFAGMNCLLRAFYSCVLNNTEPPIPYDDILRTTRIMDLIFERLPQRT